jgi:hypothetical protein
VFQLGQCGQCLQRLAEANAKSTGPYYDSRYNRDNETLLSGFCTDKRENQIFFIYEEVLGCKVIYDWRPPLFEYVV